VQTFDFVLPDNKGAHSNSMWVLVKVMVNLAAILMAGQRAIRRAGTDQLLPQTIYKTHKNAHVGHLWGKNWKYGN